MGDIVVTSRCPSFVRSNNTSNKFNHDQAHITGGHSKLAQLASQSEGSWALAGSMLPLLAVQLLFVLYSISVLR